MGERTSLRYLLNKGSPLDPGCLPQYVPAMLRLSAFAPVRTVGSLAVLLLGLLVGVADAVTGASAADILGFDTPQNWRIIEGGGALEHVDSPSGGALALRGLGWRRIQSDNFVAPQVSSNSLRIDVKALGPVASWETISIVVKMPSRGIWWGDLGTSPLVVNSGAFTAVSFSLPESVRTALAEATPVTDDLQILVGLNSQNEVILDNLRFGDDVLLPTLPQPGVAGSGKAVFVSGPITEFCSNHPLKVTTMRSNFSAIWAGDEQWATGKQAEPDESVNLSFDSPVLRETVKAYYDPVGSCPEDSSIALRSPPSADFWRIADAHLPLVSIPQDFNALIYGDIDGLQDSEGGLMAGRSLTASGFSINMAARKPVGLFVGEQSILNSGSIFGAVFYGTAQAPPPNVTVHGALSQSPSQLDVRRLFALQMELTRQLSDAFATGSTKLEYSTLTLVGKNTDVSVFSVNGDDLKAARSIKISIPTGAAAIINVDAKSADFANMGIDSTAPPELLLWNFSNAASLRISGISVTGSVLAPYADVSFSSGNLNGTLVARSLSGNGELHYRPLDADQVLGAASSKSITLKPDRSMLPGCEYQFRLHYAASATACIVNATPVRFKVGKPESDVRQVELADFHVDPETWHLTRLMVKEGIKIDVADAIQRYGIGEVGELVAESHEGLGVVDPEFRRKRHNQYHLGYRVRGGGYSIESKNGKLRSAIGAFLTGLPKTGTPRVSDHDALQRLQNYLNVSDQPWTVDARYSSPTIETLWTRTASKWKLVHQIFCDACGWDLVAADIDAETGDVLTADDGMRKISPADDSLEYTGAVSKTFELPEPFVDPVTIAIQRWRNKTNGQFNDYFVSDDVDQVLGKPLFSAERNVGPATFHTVQAANNPIRFSDGVAHAAAVAWWAKRETDSYLLDKAFYVNSGAAPGFAGDGRTFPLDLIVNLERRSSFDLTAGSWDSLRPMYVFMHLQDTPAGNELHWNSPDPYIHELGHNYQGSVWKRARPGEPPLSLDRSAGAINEGFADFFAAAVKQKKFSADPVWFTLYRNPGYPIRNLRSSFSISSPEYQDPDSPVDCIGNDDCFVHENGRLVSHWALLLSEGSDPSEGVDGDACGFRVKPIADSLDEAISKTFQLLVDALHIIPSNSSFKSLRDATYFAALSRYGQDTAAEVGRAWEMVGLGSVSGESPKSGSVKVQPWAARLKWEAASGGPWTAVLSSSGVEPISITGEAKFNGWRFTVEVDAPALKPNTTYYWNVRRGSDGENVDNCGGSQWSFKTGSLGVQLVTAPNVSYNAYALHKADGVHRTTSLGAVIHTSPLSHKPTESKLIYSNKRLDGSCKQPGPYAKYYQYNPFLQKYSNPPKDVLTWVHLGDSRVAGEPFVDWDTKWFHAHNWFPDDELALVDFPVEKPQYLYVSVRQEQSTSTGVCAEFEVEKAGIGPFYMNAPLGKGNRETDIFYLDLTKNERPTFNFSPSKGAVGYRLDIDTRSRGGNWTKCTDCAIDAGQDISGDRLYSRERPLGHCGIKSLDDGSIEWRLDACDEASDDFWSWQTHEWLDWQVVALGPEPNDKARPAVMKGVEMDTVFRPQMKMLPAGPGDEFIKVHKAGNLKLAYEGGGEVDETFLSFTSPGEAPMSPVSYNYSANREGDEQFDLSIRLGPSGIPFNKRLKAYVYFKYADRRQLMSSPDYSLVDREFEELRISLGRTPDLSSRPEGIEVYLLPYNVGFPKHHTVINIRIIDTSKKETEKDCWDPKKPPVSLVNPNVSVLGIKKDLGIQGGSPFSNIIAGQQIIGACTPSDPRCDGLPINSLNPTFVYGGPASGARINLGWDRLIMSGQFSMVGAAKYQTWIGPVSEAGTNFQEFGNAESTPVTNVLLSAAPPMDVAGYYRYNGNLRPVYCISYVIIPEDACGTAAKITADHIGIACGMSSADL